MVCFAIWEGPNVGKQKPPILPILEALAAEIRKINAEGSFPGSICSTEYIGNTCHFRSPIKPQR